MLMINKITDLLNEMKQNAYLPISECNTDIFERYQNTMNHNNPDEVSQLLFYKGYYFFRLGDFTKAINLLTRCIQSPKQKKLYRLDALSHNYLGIIHSFLRQDEIAQNDFLTCIHISQKHHFYNELAISYSNLGFLYFMVDDHQKAINYQKKALTLIKRHLSNQPDFQITCMAYLGLAYCRYGQPEQGYELYREILKLQLEENLMAYNPPVLALGLHIAYNKEDAQSYEQYMTHLLESVSEKENFLFHSILCFCVCQFLLEFEDKDNMRRLLDHLQQNMQLYPLVFLSYYTWQYEISYAKKFCTDVEYIYAMNHFMALHPKYSKELHCATLHSLEYIEHLHETKNESVHLEEKSRLDPMTGLLNKYTIQFLIDEYFNQMTETETTALLLIDMDHFKLINDTFGHLTGDAIISETAATIKHFFMDNSLCGRIGGDEFMIFVKNVDDTASLILQAELLRQEIYGHLRKKNLSVTTQASIGICFSDKEHNSFKTLYRDADNALYQAKNEGRNKVLIAPCVANPVS